MENIELFVTANTDVNRDNLKALFKREFSEPVAEICPDAIVLFYQRDRTPKNRYDARIYCDHIDKYSKIFRIINQSVFDIEVDPFIY